MRLRLELNRPTPTSTGVFIHLTSFHNAMGGDMNEDMLKLLKRITVCMEEFGLPKFSDNIPAISVIQIIKDSGFQIVNKDVV